MHFSGEMGTSRHVTTWNLASSPTPHPGDRNGEPVESNHGCLVMAALIGALGIVTLIIIVVSVV